MKVSGTYRAEVLSVDTLFCFYERTGRESGLTVYDALSTKLSNSRTVEWLSYSEEIEDLTAIEKKIGS